MFSIRRLKKMKNTKKKKKNIFIRIKNRIGQYFKDHPKAFYILVSILTLLILIPIFYIILKPGELPPPPHIEKQEANDYKPLVVQKEKKEKKPIDLPIPESRDRYVHIDTVPGDGLYEVIQASDTVDLPIIKAPLLGLAGYIRTMESSEDNIAKVDIIAQQETEDTKTLWLCVNDCYWRLRYFTEDERLTADGAMRDFWYVPAKEWNNIYSDIPDELKEIDITLAGSMIASIMQQYPYQTFVGQNSAWYWDKADYDDAELLTYSVTLQNDDFTDQWIIEYYPEQYICAYRNITGGAGYVE